MSQFKLLSKSIAMTVIALVVSTSAMAHDPKLHAKKDQMNCEKMQKNMQIMDHSKMDMKDPAMKAMMANMGKMKQMYQKNCVTNDSKS